MENPQGKAAELGGAEAAYENTSLATLTSDQKISNQQDGSIIGTTTIQTYGAMGPKLHELGYQPLPIIQRSKKPVDAGWTTVEITAGWVKTRATNSSSSLGVGLRCGVGPGLAVYAADMDFYDKATTQAVHASFTSLFGSGPIRIGQAPKALVVYAGEPGQMKMQSAFTSPDGIVHKFELLGAGQQFIAFGIHEKTGKPYTWPKDQIDAITVNDLKVLDFEYVREWMEDVLPTLVPADWVAGTMSSGAAGTLDSFEAYKPPLEGWPIERVQTEILVYLDPNCSHDEWIKVGMALYHQGEGDFDWLSAWDTWSADGATYLEDECDKRWGSLSQERLSGRGPVTLATLIQITKDARELAVRKLTVSSAASFHQRIASALDDEGLRTICADIKNDKSLDGLARGLLADLVSKRYQAALQSKPQIAAIRTLVGASRTPTIRATIAEEAPNELQRWIYTTHEDRFLNLDTKVRLSMQGFGAKFDRLIVEMAGPDADGHIPLARDMALKLWNMDVVHLLMYIPFMGELFTINGVQCANLYRPVSAPKRAGVSLSLDDESCLSWLGDHFALTIPDEVHRTHVLQWYAHNVVNPGVKIRWSPVEVGIEGDGKSIKAEMLRAAMGAENVGTVTSSTLVESSFTDFAHGKAVNICEELRLQGKSRFDVANKMKPLITNDRIEVHPKGMPAFECLNTTNYLGFSNYRDCLPLSDTDRRWMMLFSEWTSIAKLNDKIHELFEVDPDVYWDRLWKVIKDRPDICREFFERVDLADFDPHGRAPWTKFKDMVAIMEGNGSSDEALDIIAAGGYGFSEDVIDTASLTSALADSVPSIKLATKQVRALLLSLRTYSPLPKKDDGTRNQIKWKNKNRNIWVSVKGMEIWESEGSDGIRKMLDLTTASADFLS